MDRTPATPARAPQRKPARPPALTVAPGYRAGSLGLLRAPERKDGGPELKRLAQATELKFDETTGEFDGYCSKFNLVDQGGDIVRPGAFKATLADWKRRKAMPPVLWQHDPDQPIGVWTELKEDDVGLYGKGRLVTEVPQAAAARALMMAKAVTGLSIGYDTREKGAYEIDRETGARLLLKVNLWEVSVVTFPMLREAQINGAKAQIDFNPRALEAELRASCNLSAEAAVKAVAIVKKHLREGGPEPESSARDGLTELLMSLRKSNATLR